jgi:hypothetical protein
MYKKVKKMKLCNKCNTIKNDDEFYKHKDKLITPCKSCKINYQRLNGKSNKLSKLKYYYKNKSVLLAKSAKYYSEHKQYYKDYQLKYKVDHPRKLRKRRKPSIKDKIRCNVSRSISKNIKLNNGKKSSSIIKYLDFTFQEQESSAALARR